MKKIVYFILFILAISACDVLDLNPLDKISEADAWNDQALIEVYVNGNYIALPHGYRQDVLGARCEELYSIHNWGNGYPVLQGTMTPDNIANLGPTGANDIGNINYWSSAYRHIRNINIFFEKIDDSPVDLDFKNRVVGEMKFLRAYIYANLIWRHGGVPLITKVYQLNEDYSVTRNSYDECVDFIVRELDEAIHLLPAKQPAAQLGRASGDACQALKARVLLYAASTLNNPDHNTSKWQKAADAAEALLGKYILLDDYQSVFLADNNEIIFARSMTQASSPEYNRWVARNGSSGQGGNTPTQNVVNAFEMAATGEMPYVEQADGSLTLNTASGFDPEDPYTGRDPRFYASILYDGSFWQGRNTESWRGGIDSPENPMSGWDASQTSYYLKKFLDEKIPPTGSTERSKSPWIWFRYAEVLLNYAEAKFELGDENTARQYLNMVRSRKSVNMPPVTDTGENLRKRIHNERRVELVFEEHRFFDVRRWKIAMSTETQDVTSMYITKLPDDTKTYEHRMLSKRAFSEQHYLLPIPRAEVDRSLGSLAQNPGY